MAYQGRINRRDKALHHSTRTINRALWFINNPELEEFMLSTLAKTVKRHAVKLFAFGIEGNHTHTVAQHPHGLVSDFLRDTNSAIANGVIRLVKNFPGGKLWGRRASTEPLGLNDDIEEKFFYTVLQPVQDGLVQKISEYPGYNCFHDAIWGREREFIVLNRRRYNDAKRKNPLVPIKNYYQTITLKYDRLPGYEHLSQKEYAKLMLKKLEERRLKIIQERLAEGKGFLGREFLLDTVPGTIPPPIEKATLTTHRPRVICSCPVTYRELLDWYFSTYAAFKEASRRYRAGDLSVEFPPDTHKPPIWSIAPPEVIAEYNLFSI